MVLRSLIIQKLIRCQTANGSENHGESVLPMLHRASEIPDETAFRIIAAGEVHKAAHGRCIGGHQRDDPNDNNPKGYPPGGSSDGTSSKPISGTLMLDATCANQYIEYPLDINLLNQSKEDLEHIIDEICFAYNIRNHGCIVRMPERTTLLLQKVGDTATRRYACD